MAWDLCVSYVFDIQESMVEIDEFDPEDPIESLPGGPQHTPAFQPAAPVITLTTAGIRALLGRKKIRSKPLVQIFCVGCGRSCWSRCKFCTTDYLEFIA